MFLFEGLPPEMFLAKGPRAQDLSLQGPLGGEKREEGRGKREEEEEEEEEDEEEGKGEEDEDLFESYITNGTHPPAPPDR